MLQNQDNESSNEDNLNEYDLQEVEPINEEEEAILQAGKLGVQAGTTWQDAEDVLDQRPGKRGKYKRTDPWTIQSYKEKEKQAKKHTKQFYKIIDYFVQKDPTLVFAPGFSPCSSPSLAPNPGPSPKP